MVMEDREPWVVQELRGAGGRPGSSHPEVARGVSWAKYKNRTADTSTLETRGVRTARLSFCVGWFFLSVSCALLRSHWYIAVPLRTMPLHCVTII